MGDYDPDAPCGHVYIAGIPSSECPWTRVEHTSEHMSLGYALSHNWIPRASQSTDADTGASRALSSGRVIDPEPEPANSPVDTSEVATLKKAWNDLWKFFEDSPEADWQAWVAQQNRIRHARWLNHGVGRG